MAERVIVREVVDRLVRTVVVRAASDGEREFPGTDYDGDEEGYCYGPVEFSPGVFYDVQQDEWLHWKKFRPEKRQKYERRFFCEYFLIQYVFLFLSTNMQRYYTATAGNSRC